jgi:tape measure domain-containing protein
VAVIGELLLRAGLELSGLQRDVARMQSIVGSIPKQIRAQQSALDLVPPDAIQQGRRVADQLATGITQNREKITGAITKAVADAARAAAPALQQITAAQATSVQVTSALDAANVRTAASIQAKTQAEAQSVATMEAAVQATSRIISAEERRANLERSRADYMRDLPKLEEDYQRRTAAARAAGAATALTQARDNVRQQVAVAESLYRESTGRIREAQARGLMGSAEAKAAGREAATEYNKAVLSTLDKARNNRSLNIFGGADGSKLFGSVANSLRLAIDDGARQGRQAAAAHIQGIANDASSRLGGLSRNLGLYITAPVLALGTMATRSFAQTEGLDRSLESVTGNANLAADQMERLREAARLPGLGFQEAVRGSVQLQIVGQSAEEAERAIRELSNAVARSGGRSPELQRVITQYQQMASAGRILTQDLRPIIQQAPAVGAALQQAFGTINAAEIEALGLSFGEFNDRLLDALSNAPRAADGLANRLDNLGDSALYAKSAIGEALAPAVSAAAEVVEGLLTRIQEADPDTVQWGIAIAGVSALLAPLAGAAALAAGAVALFAGAVGGIATLATGGALLAIGAIGAAWAKNKLEVAAAADEQERLNDAIRTMPAPALSSELSRLTQYAEQIRTAISAQPATIARDFMADGVVFQTQELNPTVVALNRELARTGEQIEIAKSRIAELATTGGTDPPPVIPRTAEEVEKLNRALEATAVLLREAAVTQPFGLTDVSQLPDSLREGFQAAEGLRSRIDSVREAITATRDAGGVVSPAAVQEVERLEGALAKLESDFGTRIDNMRGMWERLDNLEPPKIVTGSLDLGIDSQTMVERAQKAYNDTLAQLQVSAASGLIDQVAFDEQGVLAAEIFNEALLTEIARLRQSGEIAKAIELSGLLNIKFKTKAEVDNTDFEDTLGAVREVTSAFGDMADALGALSPRLSEALRGIESLTSGAARYQAGRDEGGTLGALAQVSGVLSAVSGAIQIGRGLFGESEADRRRNELLAANNEALDRLRETMRNPVTFGDADIAKEVIAGIQAWADLPRRERGPLEVSDANLDLLRRLGEEFNIEAVDARGGINLDSLKALDEALRLSARNVEEFGQTFAGQRTLQDAFNKIFDITDPAEILQSEFEILAKQAPNLFGDLSNLDLTSGIGRDVLENRIRDLISDAMSGDLTAEALSGFESVDEFLKHLISLDDGLDGFAKSVNQATQALTNVPQGFRILNLELERFNASQRTSATDLMPSPSTVSSTSVSGYRNPVPVGSGGDLRERPTYGAQFEVGQVTFQIYQQPGQDGASLGREAWEEFKTYARQENLTAGKEPIDPWSPAY